MARQKNIKDINIGHIILFCEGPTEKIYFEYFSEILNKNKFNDIEIKLESAEGNARTVLKFAEKYLRDEENNRKYSNYTKYLIFDCDDPPKIQEVINAMMLSPNEYDLLISNWLFEIWLLMHFEKVNKKLSKKNILEKLSSHLVKEYKKANAGQIREIIANGNIEDAIENAEKLTSKCLNEGKNICDSIVKMNPYTNVHLLVEQLMAAISQ